MKALRPPRLPPLTRLTPHRTFVPNPFATTSTPQLLTATRTLPYPSAAIYNIIADVPQYSSFLPYCQASTVTRWSAPDRTTHTRWPSEARLVVGWAGITEAFRSRIYCVPGRVVEAVGGASRTTLAEEDVAHHRVTAAVGGAAGAETGVKEQEREREQEREQEQEEAVRTELLTHLLTRWTVRPLPYTPPREQTEVSLAIEFQFANPIYSALSVGAAPKVAEMMIRAFEERVKSVLEGRLDEGKSRPELNRTSRRG
ncbi:dehydrase and lipid transport-domain-containing protein [Cenococcum geophilum]